MSGVTPGGLGGEERAGAAEAGGDLVEDQHAARARRRPRASRAGTRRGRRACRPAPCSSGSTMIPASSWACSAATASERLGPGRRRRPRRPGGRGGEHLLRQHLGEHRVHPADRVAHAHAAERVAVVAAADGEHPGPLGVPDAALVLQHHLERDLDAHRAGVGEEDVLEPGRRQLDEPLARAGSPGSWVRPPNITWANVVGLRGAARRPAPGGGSRGSRPTTTTSRRRPRCRRRGAAGRPRRRSTSRIGVGSVIEV